MWLITNQGFYSVVEHRDAPGKVIVRARVEQDLLALRAQIPSLEPVENAGTDYPWRTVVNKEEWVAAVALLAAAIDYPNFKESVAERQGPGRAALYLRIWTSLRALQEG